MAQDAFHNAVKQSLKKDGWKITDEQMHLQVGGVEMYIDLAADRIIAAEKDDNKIAVEIKSFLGASEIYEFHLAMGQIRNYQLALRKEDPDRVLYLAVPVDTYERFFRLAFIQEALEYNQAHLLVYDADAEEIVRWKK